MLPKGLITKPGATTADLELFCWGTRYFVKAKAKWFSYYEELSALEQHQLFSFFTKNLPGTNPFDHAVAVTEQDLKSISVDANFPKIEAVELCRLLKLYQHYCNGTKATPNLEVGALLFYNPTLNKIKFVLPTQTVSRGSWDWAVDNNKPLVFLDPDFNKDEFYTLEQIEGAGWEFLGTTHSHNTINCTWSNGPTGDYKNQAGSKDKPLPPALHLLVYGMQNYQTEACPDFSFLASVNVLGDLINVDSLSIINVADVNYEDVNWIGAEVAEQLAKIKVYTYTAPVYSYNPGTYYNPAKAQHKAKPSTIVDAEATISYIKQKATSDPEEAAYRIELAVQLVEDLGEEDIIETIAKLVEVLEDSPQNAEKTSSDIYLDVLAGSYILFEGAADFFNVEDPYCTEVEINA